MKTASLFLLPAILATMSGQAVASPSSSSSGIFAYFPEGQHHMELCNEHSKISSSTYVTKTLCVPARYEDYYEDDYSDVVIYQKTGKNNYDILYAPEVYEKQYSLRKLDQHLEHTLSKISYEGYVAPQYDDDDYDYDYDYHEKEQEKEEEIKCIYDLIAEENEYDRFETIMMYVVNFLIVFLTWLKYMEIFDMAGLFDDGEEEDEEVVVVSYDNREMIRLCSIVFGLSAFVGYVLAPYI